MNTTVSLFDFGGYLRSRGTLRVIFRLFIGIIELNGLFVGEKKTDEEHFKWTRCLEKLHASKYSERVSVEPTKMYRLLVKNEYWKNVVGKVFRKVINYESL